jgi:serine/threonine protein kinase
MPVSDDVLLQLLGRHPAFDRDGVVVWWTAERIEGEPLVLFLQRRGVLTDESLQLVDMIVKGFIPTSRADDLLGESNLSRLPNRLQPQQPRPGADTKPMGRAIAPGRGVDDTIYLSQPYPPPLPSIPYMVGSQVGRYILVREIGRGGSCVVFEALHRTLNISVAVKFLQPQMLRGEPRLLEQLKVEARLLARLDHPNIVRIRDFEDEGDCPYLVLDYVEGETLAESVRREGRLSLSRSVGLVVQIAEALQAASALGVVHRDVKPGNVLLDRAGRVKLADLGLAVIIGQRLKGGKSQTVELIGGTAAYMAPEQFRQGEPIDQRTDIYALGVTFYHILTGTLPFQGESVWEIMLERTKADAAPPHTRVPDVPAEVSRVIARMMSKQPDGRYPGYPELLDELRRLLPV